MKKGDIVVCVQHPGPSIAVLYDSSHGSVYWDNAGISQETQYEVLGTFRGQTCRFITIANDHGIISDYRAEKFIPLSEWREERLSSLLDPETGHMKEIGDIRIKS